MTNSFSKYGYAGQVGGHWVFCQRYEVWHPDYPAWLPDFAFPVKTYPYYDAHVGAWQSHEYRLWGWTGPGWQQYDAHLELWQRREATRRLDEDARWRWAMKPRQWGREGYGDHDPPRREGIIRAWRSDK
jgi:hypothetical protein